MTCVYCDTTGTYLKPIDQESFSYYFDLFFCCGLYNRKMARDMALIEAGYEQSPCPYCDNGISS